MLPLLSIRVAEPWTPFGIVALVAIVVAIVAIALWLIRRA